MTQNYLERDNLYLFYNLLQILIYPILFPILVPVALTRKKYRSRIRQRLGIDLSKACAPDRSGKQSHFPVIWIHALSVGETTSALPLVKQLRKEFPNGLLIFTVTTRSGSQLAKNCISPYVDLLLASPLDLFFTVRHFINTLQPNLFILIETDFWPNWLHTLQHKQIPAVLVNGRISAGSVRQYHRFRWFFKPLFSCFSLLCMQTEQDAKNMEDLGVASETIRTLGNLKMDLALPEVQADNPSVQVLKREYGLPENRCIWICGSTHPGEEEHILSSYEQLHTKFPITLVIAPRDIGRADTVQDLCRQRGFRCTKRTELRRDETCDILLLDTIGELAGLYITADLVFIGGSLVPCGGHNPLEAAVHGKAILFGVHMEDFSEIAADLVAGNSALQMASPEELTVCVKHLLQDRQQRINMGEQAREWITAHHGTVQRIVAEIMAFLPLHK